MRHCVSDRRCIHQAQHGASHVQTITYRTFVRNIEVGMAACLPSHRVLGPRSARKPRSASVGILASAPTLPTLRIRSRNDSVIHMYGHPRPARGIESSSDFRLHCALSFPQVLAMAFVESRLLATACPLRVLQSSTQVQPHEKITEATNAHRRRPSDARAFLSTGTMKRST